MDSKKVSFLNAVVGPDGAAALSKAAERSSELAGAIYPRAILAWLQFVGDFDGKLPGTDSRMVFRKTDAGYDGYVTVGNDLYDFRGANLFHLAGSVAVALGADEEDVDTSAEPTLLAKLGKSIDVLLKSRLVRRELAKTALVKDDLKPKTKKSKIMLPGQAAKPNAPEAPTPPTSTQPKMVAPKPGAVATSPSKMSTPAIPGTGAVAAGAAQMPKPPKMPGGSAKARVVKSQAYNRCGICAEAQFRGNSFVGCRCFKAMAKTVSVTETKTHFQLAFGDGWDTDAIESLIAALGK